MPKLPGLRPISRESWAAVEVGLRGLGVPQDLAARIRPMLPASLKGVLVYGSWARGDARSISDLDVLVFDAELYQVSEAPSISLSYYSDTQLRSASGKLFGLHLARDGKILLDTEGRLADAIASIESPDPNVLLRRIGDLSAILDVNSRELATYLHGLTKVARYLLRSAMYARALRDGRPCFSVTEIAAYEQDPELVELLSSHPEEQTAVSRETFYELRMRLRAIAGEPTGDRFESLHSLIVDGRDADEDRSNLGLLAIADEDEDVPYSDLPKVIL